MTSALLRFCGTGSSEVPGGAVSESGGLRQRTRLPRDARSRPQGTLWRMLW